MASLRLKAGSLAAAWALSLALLPAAGAQSPAPETASASASESPATAPAPSAAAPGIELLPGEYLWLPELSPRGPVLVLVSLPEQRAYVYRNGVRIGVATVSTGKQGYETPTGVFSILQKKREHYSNLYNNAPMPFMQRLTWDGIAMHAGRIPGYPASHGCVRLPHSFSEKLFGVTARGMTVVIVDEANRAPMLADPAVFPAIASPPPTSTPMPQLTAPAMPEPGYRWAPELAPPGALSVVISTRDRQVVVVREGVEIGRGPIQITGAGPSGTLAYVLLEGRLDGSPALLPDRPRRRWLRVHGDGGDDPAQLAGALAVAPGFARAVYDAMTPGTSLVITDQPLGVETGLTVMASDVPVDAGSGEP